MKLVVLTAPSGAGKTTIAQRVMAEIPGLRFSTSATTRTQRENEIDGEDYHFLTDDEFNEKLAQGAFVEHEEVYPNVFYGTLREELETTGGESAVLLDIDVVGARTVKQLYGERALTLFICPPSLTALKERLIARGTDPVAGITTRLERAAYELRQADHFDEVIVNDDLDVAVAETKRHIEKFLGG